MGAGMASVDGDGLIRGTSGGQDLSRIPVLANRYLFGDLCTGEVFSLLPNVATQQATQVRKIGITAPNLTSFGVGANNSIYITQTTGELSRIDPF